MAYDFHTRLDHAGTRFKDMGEVVTLAREGSAGSTPTAFMIMLDAEEIFPGIVITRLEFQIFSIDAADYQINEVAVTPEDGDTITRDVFPLVNDVFRVVTPGGIDLNFRYVTSKRNRIFVFTERVVAGIPPVIFE